MKVILVAAAIIGIIILAALFSGSCATSPGEATQALQNAGYTNVKPTGINYTGCPDDDKYGRNFEATAPNGIRAKGVVCCNFQILGTGKACTVRF